MAHGLQQFRPLGVYVDAAEQLEGVHHAYEDSKYQNGQHTGRRHCDARCTERLLPVRADTVVRSAETARRRRAVDAKGVREQPGVLVTSMQL